VKKLLCGEVDLKSLTASLHLGDVAAQISTNNPYENFMRPLCLPDAQTPNLRFVCLSRIDPGAANEDEMLAITFVVSCLSVCAFYVYVLVHLERERKRMKAHEKHLPEHFYEMEPKPRERDADNPKDPPISEEILRRQTMIHLGLTLGGLIALFGGIEFFNSLVTWLHWY
jgi:hypothetical protein